MQGTELSPFTLGWRALRTTTSETPDSEVTWPCSRFNTSGPDPLGSDWEDLAASRGIAGGHSGPPLIKQSWDGFPQWTRSISLLLMPWLLSSPGHQQPWYWLCRIASSLTYLRKNFNYLCHINAEEWHKIWIYVYVLSEKFRMQILKFFSYSLILFQSRVLEGCSSCRCEPEVYGLNTHRTSWPKMSAIERNGSYCHGNTKQGGTNSLCWITAKTNGNIDG